MAWDVLSGAAKMVWDVLSGVTKTAWDVLSGVANRCGMFCLGCQKMAWDVLSRDVLSYIHKTRISLLFIAINHFPKFFIEPEEKNHKLWIYVEEKTFFL